MAADEPDKGGPFAKGFDFAVRDRRCETVDGGLLVADVGSHFGEVAARFAVVDVLQLDVVGRLGFHVREGAGEGEDAVVRVELVDCVGDEPEVWDLVKDS